MTDRTEVEAAARTMNAAAKRLAEYRRQPGDERHSLENPFKLRGIVGKHAVIARFGCLMTTVSLKEWDSWPLVDKAGVLLDVEL